MLRHIYTGEHWQTLANTFEQSYFMLSFPYDRARHFYMTGLYSRKSHEQTMPRRAELTSHLYIRIDGRLRAALIGVAQARDVTVSDLARRELRRALADAGNPGRDHHPRTGA